MKRSNWKEIPICLQDHFFADAGAPTLWAVRPQQVKKKKKVGTGSFETTNADHLSLSNKIRNEGPHHPEPGNLPRKAGREWWVGNLFPGLSVWMVLHHSFSLLTGCCTCRGPWLPCSFQLRGEFPSAGPFRAFFWI